ncbi:MAG: MerR family transcriptional regulator [Armatimonadetes bacterium]|nr:MerR family transcriptional regulator [Armatimonadota bacterium]
MSSPPFPEDTPYTMKAVAQKTGLSPHVIRVWEKRYGAVQPRRTQTNRRLYSEADVERLRLLRQATLAGHGIGQIAQLPTDKLHALVPTGYESPSPSRESSGDPRQVFDGCIRAATDLDSPTLEGILHQASVSLSRPVLLEEVLMPVMHRVGELWREGALRVAHEHMTSAIVRTFLGTLGGAYEPSLHAPSLIVATPPGQLHELGALAVAATAASEGWRVTYLGPSLPADEIAGAAHQNGSRAVALSIIYPADDPHLDAELAKLRRSLNKSVAIIVGGRSAAAYHDTLYRVGALRLDDLTAFRHHLESLRARSHS